jgi:hypothetical protein
MVSKHTLSKLENICFKTKVLKFNAKKKRGGGLVLPPSTFQSGKGDCPQLLFP